MARTKPKVKSRVWLFLGIVVFLLYGFIAAQPIPEETILAPRWVISLESGFPLSLAESAIEPGVVIPFKLGNRFGYIDDAGKFIMNRVLDTASPSLSLALDRWSAYGPAPASVGVFDPQNRLLLTVDRPRGYPFFRDGRTFVIGNEQNSVSSIDSRGNTLWTYDFPAPLTCVDAAAGLFLAGTLDGEIELIDGTGRLVYAFAPGGSRLAAILGCAVSRDGSHLAIVSGINDQRFLLLEKSGDSFRVVYHEFLSTGYRRAVHVRFIDSHTKVAFEREGGVGVYDIPSRTSVTLPLDGQIAAMDSGDEGYFFIVTSEDGNRKRLIGIKLPGAVALDAPFRSASAALGRKDSRVYVGGDQSIISFELKKQ